MQVHGPRNIIDASTIRTHLNPGSNGDFAVVTIGHVELYVYTPEECDELIKAAAKAKRLLTGKPALGAPAAYIAFGDPQPVLEGKAVQRGEHPYPDAPASRYGYAPDSPLARYDRDAHKAWHERTHPDAPQWPRQPLTDDEAATAIADYEGTGEQS